MIEEVYVSFETAKLLKEKGFPQSTFRCHYITDGNNHYKSFENRCGFGDFDIIAPTQQIAMKWLREVCDLIIYVKLVNNKDPYPDAWGFVIYNKFTNEYTKSNKLWFEYEEACEAAILYSLKNLI